ncbi:MAG TPA: hypothetical protein VGF43_17830 [Dongiaceae bacterium]|jgi:hypothetical protein
MNTRSVFAIVIVLAVVIALPLRFADAVIGYGPPAPDNYMEKGGPDSRDRGAWCPADGFELWNKGPNYIWTGGGGDTVTVGLASGARLFDSASPQTGDQHDMLVILGIRPSDVRTVREGAHLLICGSSVPFSVAIYRQYCRGVQDGIAWNNQIEEIVFPGAAEIWLADEVIDAAPDRSDIAALTRIDESKEGKAALEKYGQYWHVRRFSDVLPSGWLSSLACRRDMVKPAPEPAQ